MKAQLLFFIALYWRRRMRREITLKKGKIFYKKILTIENQMVMKNYFKRKFILK